MTIDRFRTLRDERGAVLDLCRTLTDGEWSSASDCAEWSVKDVVAHMGAAFHGCFTPWLLRLMRTSSVERSNDGDVESRRAWEPARVLREYESWSGRFVALVPVTQRPPIRGLRIPLGDIGRYPVGLLASAFTFDHHVHLRHDIAAALGRSVPPPDAGHIAAVMEWLLAGLPQMCGRALAWMDRPVALVLDGPGGGAWTVRPGVGGPLRGGGGDHRGRDRLADLGHHPAALARVRPGPRGRRRARRTLPRRPQPGLTPHPRAGAS